eukprot:TRINITY_DN13126_c0_g1_i1.p1 TRINITY_DN13126_c0_g1~~TRINITY_DN13126_c0_g1_i1.p1  ORF type:complete len:170 (+),score=75.66 TRINITY_DN13126_c0_g1_i1:44-511(+)
MADSMYEISGIPEDKLRDYKEAFSLFDKNNDGHITIEELGAVMKKCFDGKEPSQDELEDMIYEVDKDKNGDIDFKEFVQMMEKSKSDDDELKEAFSLFDKNGDGKISFKELKGVLQTLGEDLAENEIREMIEEADDNDDGEIDFEEFKQMIKGKI